MKSNKLIFMLLLSCFLCLFIPKESNAQTYTGDTTLASQTDINTFGANYTSITGNLIIQESTSGNINDLTPLSSFTSVGGDLVVRSNSALTNLDGLSGITSVEAGLYLELNSNLTNINGLSSITSVGGPLYILSNNSLTNLNGLSSITSVGGALFIVNNSSLANLDGLSSITNVGENLYVKSNYILSEFCGLYSLLNYGGLTGSYYVRDNASNPTEQEIIDGGACSPMPVELTSFTATTIGNKVQLNWHTATEVNNYGFDVERTPLDSPFTKGGTQEGWKKIGFVQGSGNSNSPKSYFFVDDNPLVGSSEYRLKQVDNDGAYKCSKVVTVSSSPTQFGLSQNYPNPFNPVTTIKYSIPQSGYVSLNVYDELGRKVAGLVNENKEAGNYEVQFDGSSFASGIYFYKIRSGKFQEVKKLLLLK